MKICVKNRRSNTWKRKILGFSIEQIFVSYVQVTEHIWKQLEAPFRKIWGQNISLKDTNPYPKKFFCGSESISEKKICGSESEKMSSDPQHGFSDLILWGCSQCSCIESYIWHILCMFNWRQYVRPQLEFAVTAWAPWLEVISPRQRESKGWNGWLELQRKMSSAWFGDPREERREQQGLLQTYKILKNAIGNINCN
jgi:hypothetical protein